MSVRAARWILWGVFVLVIPLPFFLVETGVAPAARILMLAGAFVAVVAVEGPQGVAGSLAALLLLQAGVYTTVLWWLAHRVSRMLGPASPWRVAAATAALVAVSLLVASSFEIYHTPFRAKSLRANLLQVFE
jgi:hypothetical protein